MRNYLNRMRTGQHRDQRMQGPRFVPHGATICPNCGCKSTVVIKTTGRKGEDKQRTHKCKGCKITFHSTEGQKELPPRRGSIFPVVLFMTTPCPACGGQDVKIARTERATFDTIFRAMVCSGCKCEFHSEQLLTRADLADPDLKPMQVENLDPIPLAQPQDDPPTSDDIPPQAGSKPDSTPDADPNTSG